jgi:hypothetical protein
MTARHVFVVSLWIHPGQEAAFDAHEREAARIMARHGGRIDRAVRLTPTSARSGEERPFELHLVSFPDQASYEAYKADPAAVALRERRSKIITRTTVMEGEEAGGY